MVREQNSGKKPVPAAQVVFGEANPVISDNDGLFTLSFPRKKPATGYSWKTCKKAATNSSTKKKSSKSNSVATSA
ncbi:MAG: hypothetical protein IPN33_01610 [Saprospiraceae bacterium]|nr:hypothetical protein [Saprospiraceae bacterium]